MGIFEEKEEAKKEEIKNIKKSILFYAENKF